jgi:NAD(P)-dependent dehydrogenase (short-subunit alcohol dehydrogenase family)
MKNKTIIITGGAGEIGLATAKLFAEAGSNIVLVDIDEEALQEAKNKLDSDQVAICKADVTKEADVKKYVQLAKDQFGSIDYFFNNAGIEGEVVPITDLSIDDFDQVMKVNVHGVVLGMKHVMKAMQESGNGGSIVITSSVAGLQGTPGMTPYITSKHATIGVMRTAALEGAQYGVRVNTLHPGVVDSRMMRSLESGLGEDAEAVQKSFEQQIPLGRYAQEEEIAATAFFLLSEKSKYTTGSTFVVDGGLMA